METHDKWIYFNFFSDQKLANEQPAYVATTLNRAQPKKVNYINRLKCFLFRV